MTTCIYRLSMPDDYSDFAKCLHDNRLTLTEDDLIVQTDAPNTQTGLIGKLDRFNDNGIPTDWTVQIAVSINGDIIEQSATFMRHMINAGAEIISTRIARKRATVSHNLAMDAVNSIMN